MSFKGLIGLKGLKRIALSTALFLFLSLTVLAALIAGKVPTKETALPSMLGKTMEETRIILGEAGLKMEVSIPD